MLKGANLKGGGAPAPPIDQPPLVRSLLFKAVPLFFSQHSWTNVLVAYSSIHKWNSAVSHCKNKENRDYTVLCGAGADWNKISGREISHSSRPSLMYKMYIFHLINSFVLFLFMYKIFIHLNSIKNVCPL